MIAGLVDASTIGCRPDLEADAMPRLRRLENSLDIRRLAFIGAQARLVELNVERQAILKAFPEIGLFS
jgi:hypothetical protein